MKRRTDLPEPPHFALVQRAHATARQLASRSGEGLRVGLVDRFGVLAAEGVVHGYSQATLFADLLRKLGYQELLPRTAQRLCECHFAFVAPAQARAPGAQPALPQSVLDLDLWPGTGFDSVRSRVTNTA